MAKYSKKAGDKVEKVMDEMKHGKLKNGGSGKKVTSRKPAIAIGLSEARKEGAKVPKKPAAASKASTSKVSNKKLTVKEASGASASKKAPTKKTSRSKK